MTTQPSEGIEDRILYSLQRLQRALRNIRTLSENQQWYLIGGIEQVIIDEEYTISRLKELRQKEKEIPSQ